MTMKMIISDVDGTLIGDDRREPPELDRLAELIAAHQLPFTIASGRIQGRISGLVQRLGLTLPVIGCNGASAKQGDRYLWNKTIPPSCCGRRWSWPTGWRCRWCGPTASGNTPTAAPPGLPG